jgi:hypothetical protein
MRYFWIIFLIFSLFGCKSDPKTIGMQAIHNLSKNYKPTGFLEDSIKYEFVKSLYNKYDIETQLWEKKSDNGLLRTIVFISKNEGYAIPMLPNEYIKYWEFQREDNQSDTFRINTTFQKEFFNMLNRFGLTDSVKIADDCLFDALKTILDTRIIFESDSLDIIGRYIPSVEKNEESEIAIRLKEIKIMETVYRNMKGESVIKYYDALWDYRNNRIYQVNVDSINKNKKYTPCLKVYRLHDPEVCILK